ncbi:uncharacterized protein LOC115098293 isoform X3 [Rhinatrema bivittatum]|uniref:uncharacterized protein LOC115098293 isoform X3 n=1 Tax=Rhinatrema bivittatum TaxID=194408 RepID=UPI00112852A6|nr:uncharacterized protein LOC115098293 isoform X3 [Rhinatrema bivittatum]
MAKSAALLCITVLLISDALAVSLVPLRQHRTIDITGPVCRNGDWLVVIKGIPECATNILSALSGTETQKWTKRQTIETNNQMHSKDSLRTQTKEWERAITFQQQPTPTLYKLQLLIQSSPNTTQH